MQNVPHAPFHMSTTCTWNTFMGQPYTCVGFIQSADFLPYMWYFSSLLMQNFVFALNTLHQERAPHFKTLHVSTNAWFDSYSYSESKIKRHLAPTRHASTICKILFASKIHASTNSKCCRVSTPYSSTSAQRRLPLGSPFFLVFYYRFSQATHRSASLIRRAHWLNPINHGAPGVSKSAQQ